MADDPTRKLMIELRRALVTALKAIDQYLVATSKRPERAQQHYGSDGDEGYLAEVSPRRR